jgi:hypothetical protein
MVLFMNFRTTKLQISILTVFVIFGSGCSTDDVLVGRYDEATCERPNLPIVPCTDVVPIADVSVVTIKTPVTPKTPVTSGINLPERALAEYIKVLANPKVSSTAKELRQNLAAALKSPQESALLEDRTVFNRTMIVTVGKNGNFNPADRLEATDVLIKPDIANIESWDTAVTLNTTINAGTLQVTQNRNTETDLAVAASAGAPISGSLTQKVSRGTTHLENYNATSQVDNLTVSSDGKNLRIHRQGGIGTDLTGNTIIKVDFALDTLTGLKPVFSIDGDYLDKAGKWTPPQKLTLKSQMVNVATKAVPIQADVTLTYTLRHIVSGDGTLEDVDDNVLEKTVQNPAKKVVLVPERQVGPPSIGLWSERDLPVYVQRPEALIPMALCFDNFEEANNLLAYIKHGNHAHPKVLGNAILGFSNVPKNVFEPLRTQDVDRLTVGSDCP